MSALITDLRLFFSAWELFRDPTLAGAMCGAMLGCIGVYVVLRRMVFLSAALSQTAGVGVTLAFYAQIYWGVSASLASPAVGATLATLIVAWFLLWDKSRGTDRADSLLGLAFVAGASGTLILGSKIVQELHDVQSLLFGSAVAVTPHDFRATILVVSAILVLHFWMWRGFAAVTIDRDDARVRKMPVLFLETALLVSIAVAVSFTTRVLGALPALAFSVLPAMAAIRVAPNIFSALVVATGVGATMGFAGYVLAYLKDLPVGPSQAMVGLVLVALAELIAVLRRK